MRTQSDERLVALARAGHDAAFEEIVRRYRPPLVAFATAYVAADAAEDVVQESLENSWKSLLKTDAEINLKPWLYAIVRNRALNAKRDARVHDSVDEHLAGARTPQEVVLERDQLDRVLTAVAALAPAQRKALVASAFEGRTHDQIAAALETSPASVRGLIHRARGAVRDGVGLLLPLPLVRTISELASDPAAAEAAMSGATLGIAGGAAAGGGLATKAATIVAVATVAAGAGVAVEESLREDDRIASAVSGDTRDRDRGSNDGERADNEPADAFDGASGGDTPSSSGPGPGEDEDEDDDRDDNSGPGSGDDDRRDADDDDRLEVDNSGSGSTNSGSGSLSSGPGDDGAESDDDSSGSGSSGTGSSGSGSFDSDSSGTGDDGGDFELDEPDLDSSGSGSGEELELDDSSGSGS